MSLPHRSRVWTRLLISLAIAGSLVVAMFGLGFAASRFPIEPLSGAPWQEGATTMIGDLSIEAAEDRLTLSWQSTWRDYLGIGLLLLLGLGAPPLSLLYLLFAEERRLVMLIPGGLVCLLAAVAVALMPVFARAELSSERVFVTRGYALGLYQVEKEIAVAAIERLGIGRFHHSAYAIEIHSRAGARISATLFRGTSKHATPMAIALCEALADWLGVAAGLIERRLWIYDVDPEDGG